ncbi:MAG: pyruvate synthase subunit beta, partial [Deltaproteobacteria bacterium]|nr:pyruvate synthase subunit beta [Deltaproteobacteria bacterium]
LGKLGVDTAMWVLFEVEDGVFRLTGRSRTMAKSGKKKPVEEYVKLQERFRHITPDQVAYLQAWVDNRWEQFLQRHNTSR